MIAPPFRRLSRIMCQALAAHLQDGSRPRVPDGGAILWQCFADLCAARRIGMSGPDPIALPEVLAWAELHKMPFAPHHVAVIRALDRTWLENALTKPEAQPLTPEGFDAVFG